MMLLQAPAINKARRLLKGEIQRATGRALESPCRGDLGVLRKCESANSTPYCLHRTARLRLPERTRTALQFLS